ncbi:MAG: ABC transporter substrate-binding protein [Candidatus Hodarchaeales archaeon]
MKKRYGVLILFILVIYSSILMGFPSSDQGRPKIKIGALSPLVLEEGIDIKKGLELAVEEINVAGININGTVYDFELIIETTSGINGFPNISTALTSLSKLQVTDEVIAIIGSFPTDVGIALQQNLNITPFLGVDASGPIISPYFWRIGPVNGSGLAWALMELYLHYLPQFSVFNVTIIREDTPWAIRLSTVMKLILTSLNFDEDIVIPLSATLNSVTSALTPLQSSNSNALLTLISSPVGQYISQAWASLNLSQFLAGLNVVSQKNNYFSETYGSSYGEIFLEHIPSDKNSTSKSGPFKKSYINKYNKKTSFISTISYDAVYTLKEALEQSESPNIFEIQSNLQFIDYEGAAYKIKFTNEPGSQIGLDSLGNPTPIPGAPTNITVHDLFTEAGVALRGKPYANPIFSQWQLDGVKKTVYRFENSVFDESTDTLDWPINHSAALFSTQLTTPSIPSSSLSSTSSTSPSITSSESKISSSFVTTSTPGFYFYSFVPIIILGLLISRKRREK